MCIFIELKRKPPGMPEAHPSVLKDLRGPRQDFQRPPCDPSQAPKDSEGVLLAAHMEICPMTKNGRKKDVPRAPKE